MRGWSAAAAGAVLAITGCGGDARPRLVQRLTTGVSGVSVRYPRGWRATRDNDSVVPNPRLCFIVRRGSDTVVKLVEYERPEADSPRDHPRRPRHFRLSMLRPFEGAFTRGRVLDSRSAVGSSSTG